MSSVNVNKKIFFLMSISITFIAWTGKRLARWECFYFTVRVCVCVCVCVFMCVFFIMIFCSYQFIVLKLTDVLITFFTHQTVSDFLVFLQNLYRCILFVVLVLLHLLVTDFLRMKKNTKKTIIIYRHHTWSSLMSTNTESCKICLLKSIF